MFANKTNLSYNYISETRSFYLSYRSIEVESPEVLLFDYPSGWKGKFEIADDGQNGLIIFHVTSKENTDPQNYFTGKVTITITGANGYNNSFELAITQSCSASASVFLSPADDLLIFPWWIERPIVSYKSYGGATLADVVFDRPYFTGYMDMGPGQFQIYTVPDKGFQSQYRTGKIELKSDKGTTDMIDYVQLNNITEPIWKDARASYSSGKDFVEYRLSKTGYLGPDSGSTIYEGRAYRLPDRNHIDIHISKMIEPFINHQINPDLDFNRLPDFGMCYFLEVDGKYRQSYTLSDDWSYRNKPFVQGTAVFDDGYLKLYEITDKDYIFSMVWNNGAYEAKSYRPFKVSTDGDNYITYEGCTIEQILPFEACVAKLSVAELPQDINYVRTGDRQYHINRCPFGKPYWTIYYKNSYGYYEMKRVDGKVIRKNDITSFEMTHPATPNSTQFARDKYMNEVTASYTCNITLQNKEEAADIHQLFESTEVYLWNSEDDVFIPVLVDNKNVDFKQNVKVRNYQITLIASRPETRR